jgi:hypothetical protein
MMHSRRRGHASRADEEVEESRGEAAVSPSHNVEVMTRHAPHFREKDDEIWPVDHLTNQVTTPPCGGLPNGATRVNHPEFDSDPHDVRLFLKKFV